MQKGNILLVRTDKLHMNRLPVIIFTHDPVWATTGIIHFFVSIFPPGSHN